jgi:hypothetical protein
MGRTDGDDDFELESVEDLYVHEFDDGTRISRRNNGTIRLKLPLVPPSWPYQGRVFDDFHVELSRGLGVPVHGLDKELFEIESPLPEMVAKLRDLLIALRKKYERV